MADGDAIPPVNEPGTPGGGGISSPPSPGIDQAEYDQLRAFRDQATGVFSSLEPISDDVRWMLENDENRQFIRSARETYEQQRKGREPQLDAGTKAMMDYVKPAFDFVTESQKREQQQVRAQQQQFAQKARTARDALVSQKPWLAENNDAGIFAIAAFGDRLGINDLSEAAKAFDAAGQPRGVTPPRSLRGEASGGGVPGPSTAAPIKSPKDIRDRLRTAFANQGR